MWYDYADHTTKQIARCISIVDRVDWVTILDCLVWHIPTGTKCPPTGGLMLGHLYNLDVSSLLGCIIWWSLNLTVVYVLSFTTLVYHLYLLQCLFFFVVIYITFIYIHCRKCSLYNSLTLVRLSCLNCIFRQLKLELLTQYPAPNDEKIFDFLKMYIF